MICTAVRARSSMSSNPTRGGTRVRRGRRGVNEKFDAVIVSSAVALLAREGHGVRRDCSARTRAWSMVTDTQFQLVRRRLPCASA